MSTNSVLTKGNLISKVDFNGSNLKIDQPAEVIVSLLPGIDPAKSFIRINGQAGARRFMQFTRKGAQKVTVYVQNGNQYDEREITANVVAPAATEAHYPHLVIRRDDVEAYSTWLSVANFKKFTKPGRSFKWSVSDGRTFTSTLPEQRISFQDKLDHTKPFTEFTVSVYDTTDPARATGKQVVRVWSQYHFMKNNRSTLVPESTGAPLAWGAASTLELKVSVKNIESQAIVFTQLILEYLRPNLDVNPAEKPVTIAFSATAKATSVFSKVINKSAIPADAFGVMLRLVAPAKAGSLAAETAAYLELPNAQTEAIVIKDEALRSEIKVLLQGKGGKMVVEKMPQNIISAWNRPGALEKVMLRHAGTGTNARSSAASVIGQRCQPTDPAPEPGIYCALTEETEYVLVPSRIVNARKGDIILSAGGPSGLVGGVLSSVNPPQQYSHSGIMTTNYTEVRHSTASEAYLMDHLKSKEVTAKNGFDPFKLKYMWPGTITQSVDHAFFGQELISPDGNGKRYKLTGFQHNSNFDTEINIIPPRVVKPSGLYEQAGSWMRPLLIAIAESAKKIKGHYRLYAYTDSSISRKPAFNGPALENGKAWWGAGSKATVCSSFIWEAIQSLNWKTLGIEGEPGLVTFDDLEISENNVAKVDASTMDGLYLYDKEERFQAARWLRAKVNESIEEMASEAAGDEGGAIFSWLFDNQDEIAFQLLNTFVQDKTERVDGSTPAWYSSQNPGVGHAVSPDDILRFWDAPHSGANNALVGLYGFAEVLIVRPATIEERRVSRWAPVVGPAKAVKGIVTKGGQRVPGALIKWAGNEFTTNANGEFNISMPAGVYSVEAGKTFDNMYWSERKAVTVPAGASTFQVSFDLKAPSDSLRLVKVNGTMDVSDYETFGSNQHKHFDLEPKQVFLSAPTVAPSTGTIKYVKAMGGEIRVEILLTLNWAAGGKINVAYDVKFFEGADESTNDLDGRDQGSFILAKDEVKNWGLHIWNRSEDERADNATINLRLENTRQG